MSHMRIEQPWFVLDNPGPRPPKQNNIVSGIHGQSAVSTWDQLYQDSGVGTPLFQPWDAIDHQYVSHFYGNRGSAPQQSRRDF